MKAKVSEQPTYMKGYDIMDRLEYSSILEPDKLPGINVTDTDAIIEEIIKMVKGYSPKANTDMIYVAYKVAQAAHKNQFRKSGEPYIDHPVQTAYIAAELSMDAVAISSALLHDVIEDTQYTFDDLEILFGRNVAEIVDGVTKLTKLQYTSHEEQQVENLRKMFLAMSKDIRVVIIKLIDRLHNMRTLNYQSHEKQLEKAKETLEIYSPLAHRLGMSKIKSELEDLSLKYLDPIAYEEIRTNINQKKSEREQYVADIIETLEDKMNELGIKAQITGRAKHFYSIFRKMFAQNKSIDEIYDLFAVRIIVDTVAECYAVLGMVHEMYTPIPMRFKDYIAMPKPNMYQSLHTTVVGPKGTPFEIQIRTWDMHKVAEEGIAAHWKYKEGISGQTDMDSKLEWVRQLLENQQDIMDTDEFLNNIKLDLFNEEVFALTPNGKVISLRNGSTVIDFAFAIHTQVGCKMCGAKVNGKIVPHDYKLKNGDIVEILTSPTVKGPSRDWLKIVKTSQAKTKINQWLKKECREENIISGKEYIEKECKRINVPSSVLFRDEWLAPIFRKYQFNSIDDLYASVGYGGLTAQKVVMRLNEEYVKLKKEEKSQEHQDIPETRVKKSKKTKNSGINVVGIDNCLVRLAGCCNPVPGDDIIGFITKGRGVSVHRADCSNMQHEVLSEEDKLRFIPVEWAEEKHSVYIDTMKIETEDKPGMMMAISTVLAELKLNCVSFTGRVTKNKIGIINLSVEISDTADVKKAATKIKQLPGIISVSRTKN